VTPPRLKPHEFKQGFAARLKPCPDTKLFAALNRILSEFGWNATNYEELRIDNRI